MQEPGAENGDGPLVGRFPWAKKLNHDTIMEKEAVKLWVCHGMSKIGIQPNCTAVYIKGIERGNSAASNKASRTAPSCHRTRRDQLHVGVGPFSDKAILKTWGF